MHLLPGPVSLSALNEDFEIWTSGGSGPIPLFCHNGSHSTPWGLQVKLDVGLTITYNYLWNGFPVAASAPTDLLKGNPKHFKMTSEAESAFSVEKQELFKATTSNHLGTSSGTPLDLKTDASQVSVSPVLQQMVKGETQSLSLFLKEAPYYGAPLMRSMDIQQNSMALEDIAKTTVITPFRLFEYLCMSFGLRIAAQSFQRFMNQVFRGLDFVFTCTPGRAQTTLSTSVRTSPTIRNHGQPREVQILDRGIKPLPEKPHSILIYPAPQSVKSLRRFLGVVNYYGRCISNYVYVLQPLTGLLRGNPKHFKMKSEAESAFSVEKQELFKATTSDHLGTSSGTRLALKTEASQVLVGAVLQQVVKGETQSLSLFSKKLRSTSG
nr:hypothetical transcript [Hymenolepis microstoma]